MWIAVACLVALALVISCAPQATEQPAVTTEQPAGTTEQPAAATAQPAVTQPAGTGDWVKDAWGRLVRQPRYGGTIHVLAATDPAVFDNCYVQSVGGPWGSAVVIEPILGQRWEDGPSGNAKVSMKYGGQVAWPLTNGVFSGGFDLNQTTGAVMPKGDLLKPGGFIVDWWSMPDRDTWDLHVRQDIYWQNKAPVNGRKFTAHDLWWNIYRCAFTCPACGGIAKAPGLISVTELPDGETVEIKQQPGLLGASHGFLGHYHVLYAPEVTEKYGNQLDWRNIVGTGAFFWTDYVSGNSATFTRNPKWYQYDPYFPQNRLPYADEIKVYQISDKSSAMAALRTGKLDTMNVGSGTGAIDYEMAAELMKTDPQLLWTGLADNTGPNQVGLRVDRPDLPIYDVKVRQALHMAVDRWSMAKDYFKGHGLCFTFPMSPRFTEYAELYVPLEQMPKDVQELYSYNPEKAKQLLKDAGYPNGFTFTVLTYAPNVDWLSIVAQYLKGVNVDMKIDVREYGSYLAAKDKRQFEALDTGYSGPTFWTSQPGNACGGGTNPTNICDPIITDYIQKISANYFVNYPETVRLFREETVYWARQAFYLDTADTAGYAFWWPWLVNYSGETRTGHNASQWGPMCYVWMDQAMKKQMLGK